MRRLHINLKDHSYDIVIKDGIISHLIEYISEVYKNKKIYIITDSNVAPLYLDKVKKGLTENYTVESVVVKAGEESKCFDVYKDVCEKLINLNVRRNELLLALGGGVIEL